MKDLREKINECTLLKLRSGNLHCILKKKNGLVTYINSQLMMGVDAGSAGRTSLNSYDKQLTNMYGTVWDIVAFKNCDSQITAIRYVLKNKDPDKWDWERQEKESDKEMLLNLLNNKYIENDKNNRIIAHRIEDMSEKDIKDAIIKYLYN